MAVDPHRVLQVPIGASMAEITRAYRRQAKLFHPDLQPTAAARKAATENMTRVNGAYEALKRSHRPGKARSGRTRRDGEPSKRRSWARATFRRAQAAGSSTPSLDEWWDLPRFIIVLEASVVMASLAFGLWPKWIVWTMMMLPAQISTLLLLMHLAPERRAARRNPRGSVWQALIWLAVASTLALWHWTALLLPFWVMLARYLDHVGL